MRICLSIPTVLALTLLAPMHPLPAQVVRGQVVDSITRAPVGAGFVVLLDADGAEVIRTLTSRDVGFRLQHSMLDQSDLGVLSPH